MNEEEKVLEYIHAALNSIYLEQKKPLEQQIASQALLKSFEDKLKNMEITINSGDNKRREHAVMSKIIIDSWPLSSKLGSLIIKAEKAFLNL